MGQRDRLGQDRNLEYFFFGQQGNAPWNIRSQRDRIEIRSVVRSKNTNARRTILQALHMHVNSSEAQPDAQSILKYVVHEVRVASDQRPQYEQRQKRQHGQRKIKQYNDGGNHYLKKRRG